MLPIRFAFGSTFYRCLIALAVHADVADCGTDRVSELAARPAGLEARIDALQGELESGDGEVRSAVGALSAWARLAGRAGE
jgi:hypothetical protein